MVTVRDATEADRVAVRDLHVASVRELGPEAYDDALVRAWAGDGDRDPSAYPVGDPAVEFIVAERDGDVVGFGEVTAVDAEEYRVDAAGEVRAVYVHPDAARAGVGTALLAELERRARRRGFDSLVLTASLNAVAFYERHGYERVETVVHEFGGEVEVEAVVMRRLLG